MGCESTAYGIVDTPSIDIGDCNRCAARLTSHCGSQKANGAGTNNKGSGARLRPGTVHRMDSYRQRLEEGGGLERDVVGQPVFGSVTGAVRNTELSLLVAPDSGMINPLLQRALVVRVGFGTASETQLFAQVITTFTADAAVSTSNTNLKSNSVAQLEAAHLRTNSNNFPGRFMA